MILGEAHAGVVSELVEWWEDVAESGVDSQAVLVPVPRRWGCTTVLSEFASAVASGTTLGRLVRIDGVQAPDGLGLQALWLGIQLLEQAQVRRGGLELLGVDRPFAAAQQGLGVAGLFVVPPVAAGLLVASTGVGAAGKLWDDTLAGRQGQLARAASAVARLSVSLPIAVIVDNADRLDPSLALVMIERLIERHNGQVLVVATASPESPLLAELTSRARYGLTQGRVQRVDVDPAMGYAARVKLAKQLRRSLPVGVAERIGQRTATLADVFDVAAVERLNELTGSGDEPNVLTVIDQIVDARVRRSAPSSAAVIVGWAGGIMHVRQVECALDAVNAGPLNCDEHLVLSGSLVRLVDPASHKIHAETETLSLAHRRVMADTLLYEAQLICDDVEFTVVDRVVAARAAHRVRTDVADKKRLLPLQAVLTGDLEQLGDFGAAVAIARAALRDTRGLPMGRHDQEARDNLEAAMIRLSTIAPRDSDDPLVQTAVSRAMAGGASVGLEGRVWAAVNLLSQSAGREAGLRLADTITGELQTRTLLGPAADGWRILLAFHVGRAGHPQLTQQLLAPLLTGSGPDDQSDTARQVLFAVSGPGAGTRLQILLLQAQLDATAEDAFEDRLRLHNTLGAAYARLGDYRHALTHARLEYPLRADRQGPDHPHTLTSRRDIAAWTGLCGDAREALRLSRELLPDRQRVLGPNHTDTLAARSDIANWTRECGDLREALRLFQELLPDLQRTLDRDHYYILNTRGSIAAMTGRCGDAREALRLSRELLPDLQRCSVPTTPKP